MATERRGSRKLPLTKMGTSQDVSFDASAQSSATAATTTVVRLCATQDCRYLIGSNPTALSSSVLLPAGVVEYVEITGGHKVAAIKATSATGTLNVVECV
jgi:hypothetical protein